MTHREQTHAHGWCLAQLSKSGEICRGAASRSYLYGTPALALKHGLARPHWELVALLRISFNGRRMNEVIEDIFENEQPAAVSGNDTKDPK